MTTPAHLDDDPPVDDSITLFAKLAEIGVRVSRAMASTVSNTDVISNVNIQILIHLHTHGPCRPSRLATELGVSRPQIAKLLNRLEDEHLVQRRHGTVPDRRSTMITLTPAGRLVIDAANELLRHGFDDIASINQTLDTFLQRTAPTRDTAAMHETPAGGEPLMTQTDDPASRGARVDESECDVPSDA